MTKKQKLDELVRLFCHKIDTEGFYKPWIEQQEQLLAELIRSFSEFAKPAIECAMAEISIACFRDKKLMEKEGLTFKRRSKEFLPQVLKSHFSLQILFLETMLKDSLKTWEQTAKS